MKPAYIISAYKRPDLLIRLVKSLGVNPVAIHVDKKSDIFEFLEAELRSYPNVTFLPRHICYWGLFGHVSASLEGMNWFLKTKCDYAILLTGQCYPLKSNEEIEKSLSELEGKSIIEFEKFPRPGWHHDDGGYKRLNRFHFSIENPIYQKLKRFDFLSVEIGRNEILRQVRSIKLWNRRPPLGLHPYGGSGYWCLSRNCVNYIIKYIGEFPEVLKFFSTTFIPDEMFFQTILANSPLKEELINSHIHYMDWSLKKAHPAVLGQSAVPAAMSSPAWFARKFEDVEVVDKIERNR